MRLKRTFLWITMALFVVAMFNFYYRKYSKYGYSDVLSYNQLYYPGNSLHIANMHWDTNGMLEIAFSGKDIGERNNFEVYNNSVLLFKQRSGSLKIKMTPGLKKYFIKINKQVDSILLDIDYAPSYIFKNTKHSGASSVEFSTSSLPIGGEDLHDLRDWQWDFDYSIDPKIVNAYLIDSIKIAKEDRSDIKVQKIASYILNITGDKYGLPSDSIFSLNVIEQLNAARTGKSKLWCGQYASLFAFFAIKSGLTVRMVGSGMEKYGMINAPHGFNEVYLDEFKCWAYVDITDKNVFVKKNNRFLNSVDLYRLIRYNPADTSIRASYFSNSKYIDTSFYRTAFFGMKALNFNNTLSFYYGNYKKATSHKNLIERIENFLYAKPYYAIYTDNEQVSGCHFYYRLISNYLLLVLFLIWLLGGYKFILYLVKR